MQRVKTEIYYTPRHVGEMLSLKPRTISRQCREGKFVGAIKVGRVWRIPRQAVVRILQSEKRWVSE